QLTTCRRRRRDDHSVSFWTGSIRRASARSLALLSMRLPAIIYIILCAAAAANPLPGLRDAGALVYIGSEQLSISLSPERANLKGVITFRSLGTVKDAYMKQPVLMDIPIWVPEQNPKGSNVSG